MGQSRSEIWKKIQREQLGARVGAIQSGEFAEFHELVRRIEEAIVQHGMSARLDVAALAGRRAPARRRCVARCHAGVRPLDRRK